MSPIWIVILPFAGSLCAAFLPSHARNAAVWLAGAVAIACVTLNVSALPAGGQRGRGARSLALGAGTGPGFYVSSGWLCLAVCHAGVRDGRAGRAVRALLHVAADPVPRFFSFLLAFMGAMLGIVLSGNLIQLVVFWELTSLTSFMLIAYWYHRADARRGARMALTVTAAGGLCLLRGMLMLGHIVGSYDLDVVLASGDLIRAHAGIRPRWS